jgi:hypothetical protein
MTQSETRPTKALDRLIGALSRLWCKSASVNGDETRSDDWEWFAYAPPPLVDRAWRVEHHRGAGTGGSLDPGIPVKLMPEYSVELPLWHYYWGELGLPTDLLDDLADWQATFDSEFDPERGWGDETVKLESARQADVLIARLRQALPDAISLEVDLWPLHGR